MKKLLFILLGTLTLQFSQAQAPNDNIGSGNCLDFDGSNDNVKILHHSSLDPTSQFTITAWVLLKSDTYGTIVNKYTQDVSNGYGGFDLVYLSSTNKIRFTHCTGNTTPSISSANDFSLNEWHHVAVTWDGTDTWMYIDGEFEATRAFTGPMDYTAGYPNLRIGRRRGNPAAGWQAYWDGQIDEVQIWDVARTQTQIKNTMCQKLQGNESGLVGYWNMNEGTGNTITDLTSNGNDGTLQ